MDSNIPPSLFSDNSNSQNQPINEANLYICSRCSQVPILTVASPTELRILCDCPTPTKLSLKDFLFQIVQKPPIPPNCWNTRKHGQQKGTTFCVPCQKWMCGNCLTQHNEKNSSHQISFVEIKIPTLCEEHKTSISFYCRNCKKHLCQQCLGAHGKHDITNLFDYLSEKEFYALNSKFIEAKKIVFEYNTAIKKELLNQIKKEMDKVEGAFERSKEINEALLKYYDILIKNYICTKSTPNYQVITNLLKNNISLERFILIPNETIQTNIENLIDFLNNKFSIEIDIPKNKQSTSLFNMELSKAICIKTLEDHKEGVSNIVLLNDRRLATCSLDGTIKVFNSTNYDCAMTIPGHKKFVNYIAQLDDGKIISCSSDQTLKIWRINKNTFKCEKVIDIKKTNILKIICLTNKRIAMCANDKTIKIRQGFYPYGLIATMQGHTEEVRSIIQIKDGRIVSGSYYDNTLRIWNSEKYVCVKIFEGINCCSRNSILELNDDKLVIGGTGGVTVVGLKNYNVLRSIKAGYEICSCLMLLPDGSFFLASDNNLFHWDANFKTISKKKRVHEGAILGIVSINDKCFATCSADKTIKIWKF